MTMRFFWLFLWLDNSTNVPKRLERFEKIAMIWSWRCDGEGVGGGGDGSNLGNSNISQRNLHGIHCWLHLAIESNVMYFRARSLSLSLSMSVRSFVCFELFTATLCAEYKNFHAKIYCPTIKFDCKRQKLDSFRIRIAISWASYLWMIIIRHLALTVKCFFFLCCVCANSYARVYIKKIKCGSAEPLHSRRYADSEKENPTIKRANGSIHTI